mgnify:CR=1 FL=1
MSCVLVSMAESLKVGGDAVLLAPGAQREKGCEHRPVGRVRVGLRGVGAVALAHDAVLVVAVRGRAQPQRADDFQSINRISSPTPYSRN